MFRGFRSGTKYRGMFPDARLKAFCYNRATLQKAPDTYRREQPVYYYAKLKGTYTTDGSSQLRGTGGKAKGPILLGLEMEGEPVSRPPDKTYTRGILRVLYKSNRADDMPPTKKHEIFIPYPEKSENSPTFSIEPEALENFYRLPSGRKKENERRKNTDLDPLPYALKGSQPFPGRDNPYCLKDKDIVFFVPGSTGESVVKLRVSQLWREEIPHPPHDFFKAVHPELLPFHKGREKITPAEAMFGFAEVNEKGETEEGRALASRGISTPIFLNPRGIIPLLPGQSSLRTKERRSSIPSPSFWSRRPGGGYVPGEFLPLSFTLVGKAIEFFPFMACALALTETRRLGRDGKVVLEGITDSFPSEDGNEILIYDGKTGTIVGPGQILDFHLIEQWVRHTSDTEGETDHLRVRFLTPFRFRKENRLGRKPDFNVFMRNVFRRLIFLSIHSPLSFEIDVPKLLERTGEIHTNPYGLRWHAIPTGRKGG